MAVPTPSPPSDLRLFRDFERVIDFDAQVPHGRLQFGVPEEQLYGAKILGSTVDQRCFGPSHRVRPIVGAVKTKFVNPMPEKARVLSSAEMGRIVNSARKKIVVRLQSRVLDPRLQSISGGCRDFELNRSLGLVLHDSGAGCHLVAMADFSDFECDQVAPAQLTVYAQVKERQFSYAPSHLKADTKFPNVLGLERRLLPDDLALVPRIAMSGISYCFHDGLPSS